MTKILYIHIDIMEEIIITIVYSIEQKYQQCLFSKKIKIKKNNRKGNPQRAKSPKKQSVGVYF